MHHATLLTRIYNDAVSLLHQARDYVQDIGPFDLCTVPVDNGLALTTEATRITTRLTHVVAWYMTQKALLKGEINLDEARSELYALFMEGELGNAEGEDSPLIPTHLQDLLKKSRSLYERVVRLDTTFRRNTAH